MKATRTSIFRSVDNPDRAVRLYLFYGPDDSGSRALVERLRRALGAEKVAVAAGAVKADPALLAAEAAAISLFGGPRLILVDSAGEEVVEGVEALLDAAAVESPVAVIAGALRKTSGLLKLAEAHEYALAHVSYAPEGRDADRMVIDAGRIEGLRMANDVAARLAAGCNANQAILGHELAKLALFLDAAPDRPKDLTHDVLDQLGAEFGEGDMMRLGDLALSGRAEELFAELDRLALTAGEAIPVVRALQRRLLQLAGLRARVEQGQSVDAVMTSMGKSLFWKDKGQMQQWLSAWNADRLAAMVDRAATLEKAILFSRQAPVAALEEELVTIARAAQHRR